jgi:hypothetical protein
MGNEAACKLRYKGKTFSGKALLETAEILFRGETRLKIPFPAISKLQARDGELHIETKEGLAVFTIGAQAEKWREKIANPKTLIEKLGVKPGEAVSLIGEFPADFVSSLKKHGATIARDKTAKDAAWYFLAGESQKDLQRVRAVANGLKGAAALWIVYPKGQTAITESDVRASGLSAGLTDIKVASFSPTHTALKFVVPKAKRG